MKLAILAHSVPPHGTGQAMQIYRLLEGIDPGKYCLISAVPIDSETGEGGFAKRLPTQYYDLPGEGRKITRGHRFINKSARDRIELFLTIVHRYRQLRRIMIREQCDALMAFTGDVTHLPAGFMACRRLRIPFYAFVVDHYLYREWHTPAATYWARRLEPTLMKRANKVIVLNEALRDDLRERFGVEATINRNSIDLSVYEGLKPAARNSDGIKIVFTGAIYQAHYDTFRNLMAAIDRLGRDDIKAHIYSGQKIEELHGNGIRDHFVLHPPISMKDIPQTQRDADILFLPLAFESPYPGVIKTSAPTKMGEFLAAGAPILVHAPADSYLSSYFQQHDCGVVVDQNDPGKLAEAIERILSDAELRKTISANARKRARIDFDIKNSRAAFAELVGWND